MTQHSLVTGPGHSMVIFKLQHDSALTGPGHSLVAGFGALRLALPAVDLKDGHASQIECFCIHLRLARSGEECNHLRVCMGTGVV